MTAILKILKCYSQSQFDIRYEKIVPNYAKKVFVLMMAVMDDVTGWHESCPFIHVYERLALRAIYKANVSPINANIVIVLLVYTCLKQISINNTFRDRWSNVNATGLQGDVGTWTAITPSILGLAKWNKNWNVGNSFCYVATATKIRFHGQFPRSAEAAFGGHIGWLLKKKL